LNTVWIGAVVAALAMAWNQVKSFWISISSYAIVRIELDWNSAKAVGLYLAKYGRKSRHGVTSVGGGIYQMKGTNKWELQMFEMPEQGGFWWLGIWPVWLGACANAGNPQSGFKMLSFIRGTFDRDELLTLARDYSVNTDDRQHRYGVTVFQGRDKSVDVMPPGDQTAKPAMGPLPSRTRFITCKQEDIGESGKGVPTLLQTMTTDELENLVTKFRNWYRGRAWYLERNIPWKFGACLYGPPGTGKSSMVRAIAMDYGLPIFQFDLGTMSSNELTNYWKIVLANTPCIALFEDLDNVFDGRTPVHLDNGLSFDTFLQCLSGVAEVDGVAVFVTTNDYQKIDPAVRRPGRAGEIVEFKNVDETIAREVCHRMLKGLDQATIDLAISQYQYGSIADLVAGCIDIGLEYREQHADQP